MTHPLSMIVNGNAVNVDVEPGEMLAQTLRQRLRLTGTKIGCEENECGACTVIVDQQAVLSCSYPALRAQGKRVITIEGLTPLAQAQGIAVDGLHPLQAAFVQQGAVQCGFCIPGQIMTAFGLWLRNPNPTSDELRHVLKDTLCRCGGYPAIESAILSAFKTMRDKTALEDRFCAESARPENVIGRVHIRPEAVQKVNGTALYTDDVEFEGMVYGKTLRAHVPNGRLLSIDTHAAKVLPGVLAVLTAQDIPASHYHGLVVNDWAVLIGVGERIRYVGDALAIIAAETEAIAAQALSLINVEIEPLPVLADPHQALAEGAEQLHPKGNLLKHIKVRKGDVKTGFAQAELQLEGTYFTNPNEHAFIEPECSIARVLADDRLEIYVGSQIPYSDRSQVAACLGMADEQVRIIGMMIGGGFGGKEDITGQIHAALLAKATKRPVKILYDRHESLLVHPKRHATEIIVKMAADGQGRLKAVETTLYGDTGAYASLGEKVMTRATTHSSGPYEIENVSADCYATYTNNPPAGAFRGFGVLQSAFAIESLMDELAEKTGVDPIDLRLMNALDVGSVTNTGQVLHESVGLKQCIHAVKAEFAANGITAPFKKRVSESDPHLVRAWGFAVGYKNTGLGGGAPDKSTAEVELYEDGCVESRSSSAELGQGLVTVLQMIAAEELGLNINQSRVLLSDTDLTPDGGPTTASRQTYVTGNAVKGAAKALREAISAYLSEKLDCPPRNIQFIEGLAIVDKQKIMLGDVAKMMKADNQTPKVRFEYWAPATKPLGDGGDMHFAYSFSAQAAEVEVNCHTGEVKVLHVISAVDVGKAINPLGLQAQIEGGVVMGIGHALTEKFIVEAGRVITDRLSMYRMPNITQTPQIKVIVVEAEASTGPYGAKGVGEIVCIPTIPAITNAIYHATGVRIRSLPVDQELIAMSLHEKLQKERA